MKSFEKTHAWLTYKLDLTKARPELWIALGESASKCEHLSRVPLQPDTAKILHQIYLAKGVAATTAIEGNTLSEADVLKAIEGNLQVPPSKEYLKQEVDNIKTLCNQIATQVAKNTLPTPSTKVICDYNRQALEKLPLGEGVVPGNLRTHSVLVGNVYRGAPAEDCEYLLDKLFIWLNGLEFEAPDNSPEGMVLVFNIIKAIIAHVYLAWIHPFGDGNGRTARLLEFHILLAAGIPSPAAHLLSNHYNQTRAEYYRQLDYASKSGGDLLPFIFYAVRGFVDGLREQLGYVWTQQYNVAWRNYVHDIFQHRNSKADIRQRHLALDLGLKKEGIPLSEITELTPRLARAYAGKTPKTIQRDLNALEKMNLIVKESRRVKAKDEIIFSFLPLQKRNNNQNKEINE